ncbi:MAG: GxxExxY protein [Rhodospirillales bacterium]
MPDGRRRDRVGRNPDGCKARWSWRRGDDVQRQVSLPVDYDGQRIEAGFRIDILVDGKVMIEVMRVVNGL